MCRVSGAKGSSRARSSGRDLGVGAWTLRPRQRAAAVFGTSGVSAAAPPVAEMQPPLALLLLAGVVGAVPRDRLYPFGADHGDQRLPPSDEGSSPEFELSTPVHFYDEVYNTLYVSPSFIFICSSY